MSTSHSHSHKTSNIQLYRMMIHDRPLHPELFDLQARRMHRQNEYEVECWVFEGGHVARFTALTGPANRRVLNETVITGGDHLPENGLVHALPCLGEKDYELERPNRKKQLGFVTTIQTEQLSDNLYQATFRELQEFGREVSALRYEWADEDGGRCLSMIDAQNFRGEYHLQSYHLIAGGGFVLRTQTIFELPTA